LGTGECKIPGGGGEARWDVCKGITERERARKNDKGRESERGARKREIRVRGTREKKRWRDERERDGGTREKGRRLRGTNERGKDEREGRTHTCMHKRAHVHKRARAQM
jgi:hypothetical protein